jgi:tetratricopeptide (TPR) repeat protein
VTSDPYALSEALVAAQRWDSARSALGEALAGSPEDPRLLGLLVRTLRAQGARAEALDASQRLLALTPQDPYALRLGTLVCLDVGWVDEAIGLARRAVERDPGNAANHLALSRAWAGSSRPEAVANQLAAAREAVLLDPNSTDAQVQIGAALAAEGDIEAARAAYFEALRRDPANTAALNNLAVLEMQSGSAAEAARHLASALAANPQGASALHNLDALAIVIARRAGRWMLVAPFPGLVAAAAGLDQLARLLAVLALVTLPVVGLRWWAALTAGQRRALRGLPGRMRARTWAWPVAAAVVGGWALVRAGLMPASVTAPEVVAYLGIMGYLLLLGALGSTPVRVLRARAAGRSSDIGRMLGGG